MGEHLRLLVQKVLCLLLLRVEALALLLDDLDTLDLALALLIQLLESVGGRGGVRNVALVVRGLAAFATGHVMRLGSGCAAVKQVVRHGRGPRGALKSSSSPLCALLNGLHVAVRADDVLEVLQETRIVLVLGFGLHHRNLLHLALHSQSSWYQATMTSVACDDNDLGRFVALRYTPCRAIGLDSSHLQDEEPVVVQVDAMALELLGHVLGWRLAVIDVVVRLVAAMSRASDAELRARDSLVLLALLPCNKRVHRLRTPHNGMEFSCQCHPQRLEPVAMLSRHADSRDREIA